MISRVFRNHKSFGETCAYVCQEQTQEQTLAQVPTRGKVLYAEGVRTHDHRLMAADFAFQHGFIPWKESPVFHAALSFPHGEDPGERLMVEIAKRYLSEIGMENTQYAIVRHTDTAHNHLHIIANKVNNDGEPIGKGLIIERGIKAAQRLTHEYGLTPENGKNLSLTHLDALNEYDNRRYRLYEAIKMNLPHCRDMDDLEKHLLEQGITTRYRLDPVSGERQGVSFRIEQTAFAGSRVDPSFSYGKLEATLQQQLKQRLEMENALQLREKTPWLDWIQKRNVEELRQERTQHLSLGH